MSLHGWKDLANRSTFLWKISAPCFQELNNINSAPFPKKSMVRIQSARGSLAASWAEKKGFVRQNFQAGGIRPYLIGG